MNQVQIEYFLTVVRSGGFTRASEELFVTQPTVSRQISTLEAELGIPLFDRSTKKTAVLTPAGVLFYELFNRYEADLAKVINQARTLNGTQNGRLVIGCLQGWDIYDFLGESLERYRGKHPGISLSLEYYGFKELRAALKSERIDAVITFNGTFEYTAGLSVLKLTEVPRILLYSARHPKATLTAPKPEDFRDEVFFTVDIAEDTRAVEQVKAYCEPYHFTPRIQTLPNIESIVSNVHNGLGVAIFEYWIRERTHSAFRHIELDASNEVVLVWRRNNMNPAIRYFVDEIASADLVCYSKDKEKPL